MAKSSTSRSRKGGASHHSSSADSEVRESKDAETSVAVDSATETEEAPRKGEDGQGGSEDVANFDAETNAKLPANVRLAHDGLKLEFDL